MERPDDGDGGHMTLMEHLAELRNRLIKSVVAVAVVRGGLLDPLPVHNSTSC